MLNVVDLLLYLIVNCLILFLQLLVLFIFKQSFILGEFCLSLYLVNLACKSESTFQVNENLVDFFAVCLICWWRHIKTSKSLDGCIVELNILLKVIKEGWSISTSTNLLALWLFFR